MSLPVVVPQNCGALFGDDACAVLQEIDGAFDTLNELSLKIEDTVSFLLEEREDIVRAGKTIAAERDNLLAQKADLTNQLTSIVNSQTGDRQALADLQTTITLELSDVRQALAAANNELAEKNVQLEENAQAINGLMANLQETRNAAKSTFRGMQQKLETTHERLQDVSDSLVDTAERRRVSGQAQALQRYRAGLTNMIMAWQQDPNNVNQGILGQTLSTLNNPQDLSNFTGIDPRAFAAIQFPMVSNNTFDIGNVNRLGALLGELNAGQ